MTITINNNPDEWKNLKNEIENGLLNNHTSEEKNLQIEVYPELFMHILNCICKWLCMIQQLQS